LSRSYPAARAALWAVIETTALPADSITIPLVAASAVARRKRRRAPRRNQNCEYSHDSDRGRKPAPELAVPYWIDADGKERSPITLKELGTRRSQMSLPVPGTRGAPSWRPPRNSRRNDAITQRGIAASTSQSSGTGLSSVKRRQEIPEAWRELD